MTNLDILDLIYRALRTYGVDVSLDCDNNDGELIIVTSDKQFIIRSKHIEEMEN